MGWEPRGDVDVVDQHNADATVLMVIVDVPFRIVGIRCITEVSKEQK